MEMRNNRSNSRSQGTPRAYAIKEATKTGSNKEIATSAQVWHVLMDIYEKAAQQVTEESGFIQNLPSVKLAESSLNWVKLKCFGAQTANLNENSTNALLTELILVDLDLCQ